MAQITQQLNIACNSSQDYADILAKINSWMGNPAISQVIEDEPNLKIGVILVNYEV